MSVFRSYFSKNNTLIEESRINNSQNPVTEISYGTLNARVGRFIFDVDFQPLVDRINQGLIKQENIQRHVLRMTNTIRYRPDLIGGKFSDCIQQRTGSFDLELFNVTEDWDEGNGYDLIYIDEQFPKIPRQASNWFDRKTDVPWSQAGGFISGATTGNSEIIGMQSFEKGNEDIFIDITDYVNSQIFSGSTGFTGTTFGLGIKFPEDLEILETLNRQAVAFFAKKTNTVFEPYIETYFDDTIIDDRNYFFLDKDNDLYLYANVGNQSQDLFVSGVTIVDYEGVTVGTITGDSIENVSRGVYRISVNIASDAYPDAVIFSDIWTVVQNGRTKNIEQEFYLISQDQYFNFGLNNRINPDNYFFSYFGVKSGEKFKRGEVRRVEINIKELYPIQDNFIPLDIEYRIYSTQSSKFEFDIVPWTKANRTSRGFEFNFDTSWLIPTDYYLETKIINSGLEYKKEKIGFTVVSDGVTGV